MNTIRTFKNGNSISVIEQSRSIKNSLGTVVAARYLKGKGFSVEASLFILCQY
jgi:hypothetical protein